MADKMATETGFILKVVDIYVVVILFKVYSPYNCLILCINYFFYFLLYSEFQEIQDGYQDGCQNDVYLLK